MQDKNRRERKQYGANDQRENTVKQEKILRIRQDAHRNIERKYSWKVVERRKMRNKEESIVSKWIITVPFK
jgi:hypothetical protein